jgi:membrane-associated protease RseP (regulator of RpoE activity)
MMKAYRILAAALLCAVLLPAAAQAQVQLRVSQRGVLGIMTQPIVTQAGPSRERVIMRVVPGSPADDAGLVAGDTILSINRVAATEQVMNAPFEPGDTVVVRVRRSGREQEVTVVAGERSEQFRAFTVEAIPDSVLRHMQVIVDAVRSEMDTLRTRAFTIERMHGDSVVVFRFGGDSVPLLRFRPGEPVPDSVRAYWLQMADSMRVRSFHLADSMRIRGFEFADRARILADSLAPGGAYFRALPGAEGWSIAFGDSATAGRVFVSPGEIMAGGMSVGFRAVAGAELSELNPGLAGYFGTAEGVLVLNARDGTPAARAGIMAGDVIVEVDGTKVSSIAELRRAFRPRPEPGATVRLRLLRRGEHLDVDLPR